MPPVLLHWKSRKPAGARSPRYWAGVLSRPSVCTSMFSEYSCVVRGPRPSASRRLSITRTPPPGTGRGGREQGTRQPEDPRSTSQTGRPSPQPSQLSHCPACLLPSSAEWVHTGRPLGTVQVCTSEKSRWTKCPLPSHTGVRPGQACTMGAFHILHLYLGLVTEWVLMPLCFNDFSRREASWEHDLTCP